MPRRIAKPGPVIILEAASEQPPMTYLPNPISAPTRTPRTGTRSPCVTRSGPSSPS